MTHSFPTRRSSYRVPASYAITRFTFMGRRQLSAMFIAVYMFPQIIIAVPVFVGFQVLGIGSSLIGLTIAYIALTVPVSVHMLRSYMEGIPRSEEHTSELQSLMRISYAVFCL